jgi:alpha-N-arabinofuranosidase
VGKFNNCFMNLIKFSTDRFSFSKTLVAFFIFAAAINNFSRAQTNSNSDSNLASNSIPVLQINAAQSPGEVSPTLYGLMTEDINFALEGGLYAELIRNRTFKANDTNAIYWDAVGTAQISLDATVPLNDALNLSLKLDASQASKDSPAGFANGGFWGIPVKPDTKYRASFYAKTDGKFSGALTVKLQSADGKTVFCSAEISGLTGDWKKFETTLKTKNISASKDNELVITADSPGTIWFQQVSLFPPTYKNRANGTRPDLMELMAGMQPKFLRFPGGNFLEGNEITNRFDWKKTIGDISQRPGHRNDGWGYWTTDGFGLLEFLEWCEDLKMQPVLAVYAGYSMYQRHVAPGNDLQPYVQDALDEIEYVTGDASTKWGAQRIKDGHPAPFPLHYVEVGNEDWFDKSGSYDGRFAQIYDAIKAKYPQLQIISTVGNDHPESQRVHSRTPDLIDEHYYKSEEAMEAQANMYDNRPRDGKTKIFVGEWATRVGSPTPNMAGALGDAAWMCGMERNSDLVLISSYAPLFVNVSDLNNSNRAERSMQWPSDLLGYDALNSYGSPSYYAQKIFSTHHGDEILATTSQNIQSYEWQPPARRNRNGDQTRPAAQQIRKLFFDATRDRKTGTIFLKVVNSLATAQPVKIEISGVNSISSKGKATVLKAENLDDTNSIQEPKKVFPVTQKVSGLSANFTREFPPYSITILELKTE